MTTSYLFSFNNLLSSQPHDHSLFLADGDELDRLFRLKTQVKSGDFFVTLATRLDQLSEQIQPTDKIAAEELQMITEDLLHIQANYRLTETDKNIKR